MVSFWPQWCNGNRYWPSLYTVYLALHVSMINSHIHRPWQFAATNLFIHILNMLFFYLTNRGNDMTKHEKICIIAYFWSMAQIIALMFFDFFRRTILEVVLYLSFLWTFNPHQNRPFLATKSHDLNKLQFIYYIRRL